MLGDDGKSRYFSVGSKSKVNKNAKIDQTVRYDGEMG